MLTAATSPNAPHRVHHHHGPGTRCDFGGRIFNIHPQLIRFRLAKYRHQPQPQHGKHGGPEGACGNQNLAARFEVQRVESGKKRGGPVAVGQRVLDSKIVPAVLFKFLRHRMAGELSILQNPAYGGMIFFRNAGPAQGFGLIEGDRRRSAQKSGQGFHSTGIIHQFRGLR